MRSEDYVSAAKHFLQAHQINSQDIALRVAMLELRTTITTKPWCQKRRREELSDERRRVTKKTNVLLASDSDV
jgi:hypothetical protein